MTRLRLIALAVALAGTACSGGTAPSSLTTTTAITLRNGDYLLTVSLGALPPIGGPLSFCLSSGQRPPATTAVFPVRVTGTAQGWTARMPQTSGPGGGSLEMTLTPSGNTVSGTVTGNARTEDGTVTLTFPSPAPLTGSVIASNNVGGEIDGAAELSNSQGSISCRTNGWTLVSR